MIRWGWGKRGNNDCSRCSATDFSVRLRSGTRGPKGEMICCQSLCPLAGVACGLPEGA